MDFKVQCTMLKKKLKHFSSFSSMHFNDRQESTNTYPISNVKKVYSLTFQINFVLPTKILVRDPTHHRKQMLMKIKEKGA